MNESEGKGDSVRPCGVASEKMRLRVIEVIGMAMGRGGAEGWGLRPRPVWFYLAPSPPRLA